MALPVKNGDVDVGRTNIRAGIGSETEGGGGVGRNGEVDGGIQLHLLYIFGHQYPGHRSICDTVYTREQPCRLLQERSVRCFEEEIILWLELSDRLLIIRFVKVANNSLGRKTYEDPGGPLQSTLRPLCR